MKLSDQITHYLQLAIIPDIGNVDGFDASVSGDGGLLQLVTFGYGTPPINDPSSLAPHGIFDTYFEIYEFQFDGSLELIGDTQPGHTDDGLGYAETFDITINSLLDGVSGLHFDLFTVSGEGIFDPAAASDSTLVNSFATFDHDAQFETPNPVPEPATMLLFATGLVGITGLSIRRRKK